MTAKIGLLRSRTFKDNVENPTLEGFDFEELKIPKDQQERKRKLHEQIREDEQFSNRVAVDEKERLKQ